MSVRNGSSERKTMVGAGALVLSMALPVALPAAQASSMNPCAPKKSSTMGAASSNPCHPCAPSKMSQSNKMAQNKMTNPPAKKNPGAAKKSCSPCSPS